ncbi:thioredoxin domain-containing protein 11, partial [Osmerus eperlanus]|uniref:thioredoxin domain-containing protein 11 n=1 Tax=Osmerus eperlanus TaxID=29151 RepID=UPI002E167735
MLRRLRQSLRQLLVLMARRPQLFCGAIVLSILLILAIKFTCSRAREVVAPPRPPQRFFSPAAPVVDLYLGQLDQVERLRALAEVSLVFFYAPWCAHSTSARQEVQEVAWRLSRQVQFLAVNCWWSQGKCRKQKTFYHYPVIHLFYRRFGPIEYKGPLKASYVESFILRVITPLTYLPSRATLLHFLSHHQPGVVGFFQFSSSPQPRGYLIYLSSALQALKRDFRGAVRFGVVTSRQVADAISVSEDQTIYLHRHLNSSLIFPHWEQGFSSEAICSWVFQHRETVLRWLQPPAPKSRLLEQELTKGPALLLFLPHNPMQHDPDPLLMQVADVAMRYHSCPSRWGHYGLSRQPHSCCHSLVLPRPGHAPRVCDLCLVQSQRSNHARSSPCTLRFAATKSLVVATVEACSHVPSSYSDFGLYSACCRGLRPRVDPGVTLKQGTAPPALLEDCPSSQEGGGITGLLCRTNKTLRFYVLDSALHWPLAVRLGALGNGSGHETEAGLLGARGGPSFATIVSLKEEVHYVLDHRGSTSLTQSLEDFIRNFSAPYSPLQRQLVGEGGAGVSPTPGDHAPPSQDRPLIMELTTTTFLPAIMDPHKDVLLFYYTQWCGFCSSINHIIIQLARLLQTHTSITIARVNVARNDLPWEFMVDHIPSVLLLPRHRKHLSVKFPEDTPLTLPTLLRFILKHTGPAPSPRQPIRAPGSLRSEIQELHRARQRLANQLAALWHENQRLALHSAALEEEEEEEGGEE